MAAPDELERPEKRPIQRVTNYQEVEPPAKRHRTGYWDLAENIFGPGYANNAILPGGLVLHILEQLDMDSLLAVAQSSPYARNTILRYDLVRPHWNTYRQERSFIYIYRKNQPQGSPLSIPLHFRPFKTEAMSSYDALVYWRGCSDILWTFPRQEVFLRTRYNCLEKSRICFEIRRYVSDPSLESRVHHTNEHHPIKLFFTYGMQLLLKNNGGIYQRGMMRQLVEMGLVDQQDLIKSAYAQTLLRKHFRDLFYDGIYVMTGSFHLITGNLSKMYRPGNRMVFVYRDLPTRNKFGAVPDNT